MYERFQLNREKEMKATEQEFTKFKIGDTVRVKPLWGGRLGGKLVKVVRIEKQSVCESGFMVKTDGYYHMLDSNWFEVLKD